MRGDRIEVECTGSSVRIETFRSHETEPRLVRIGGTHLTAGEALELAEVIVAAARRSLRGEADQERTALLIRQSRQGTFSFRFGE
jgi:hypothetical protein